MYKISTYSYNELIQILIISQSNNQNNHNENKNWMLGGSMSGVLYLPLVRTSSTYTITVLYKLWKSWL